MGEAWFLLGVVGKGDESDGVMAGVWFVKDGGNTVF